jgi:hypothetical protein
MFLLHIHEMNLALGICVNYMDLSLLNHKKNSYQWNIPTFKVELIIALHILTSNSSEIPSISHLMEHQLVNMVSYKKNLL